MAKIETVSIIHQNQRILLGMKKDRFGKGRYNGFGGGIEKGERVLESALRETKEEAGIIMLDPAIRGEISFQFLTDEPEHYVYFIRTTQFEGTPKETEEMKPEWFGIENIPYDEMWPADRYWLPILLEGMCFRGKVFFNDEWSVRYKKIERLVMLNKNELDGKI
jgi:8-oxo-dGTP pyrophosphatase MutT (NUDIX family)